MFVLCSVIDLCTPAARCTEVYGSVSATLFFKTARKSFSAAGTKTAKRSNTM